MEVCITCRGVAYLDLYNIFCLWFFYYLSGGPSVSVSTVWFCVVHIFILCNIWYQLSCSIMWLSDDLFLCRFISFTKGIVNCQNKLDKGVPRMQQWPLDIPQWHITPHPQLSANIIIQFAFHTHCCIKSKFPNHINSSIYLSDIYEEVIHQFSYVGFVLRHKQLCYYGGLETVDSQHIDSESFPSQHGTLTKCWFYCRATSQTLV